MKTFGMTDKFDNSDYPENNKFHYKTNKFKDEAAGSVIKEFIGLRSKMYSQIKDNNENCKTAKGIKKIVIKKDIKHEDYKKKHCSIISKCITQ